MQRIEENGVAIQVPENSYFKFDKCEAKKRLSGLGVKDMDVCWLQTDSSPQTLWIVEFKAFANPENPLHLNQDVLSNPNIVDDWLNEFEKKVIHTLCMLETNRSGTRTCVNQEINEDTKFNLVFLINFIHGQEIYATDFQRKLNNNLKPYLAIYNIHSLLVLPYNLRGQAGMPNWIV